MSVDGADLVRRVYAAVNAADDATLEALFVPGMVRHELTDMVAHAEGSGAVTDFLGMLRTAIPDLHMEVEDVFATEDGRVAARSTVSGTQRGEFMGEAPSGRRASFAAITLYRIEGGRLRKRGHWWTGRGRCGSLRAGRRKSLGGAVGRTRRVRRLQGGAVACR